MKILITLLLISAFISPFCSAQTRKISNAQRKQIEIWDFNRQHRIKNILTALVPDKNADFYDGKLTKIERIDSLGKTISTSEYEAYSDSVYSTYKYADDGYLIEIVKKAAENNVLTITYHYDSTGHITRISTYGGERKDFTCKYDKKGNLVLKLGYEYFPKFDNNGKTIPNETQKMLVDEIKYFYDKKNNLIKEKVKINGKHIRTSTYRYNKQGLKIEEINKYLGNKVRYKYTYDKNNKLIEFVRYNIDGSKNYFKVEYQYYNES